MQHQGPTRGQISATSFYLRSLFSHVARTMIGGGGGGHIHISMTCHDSFFWNSSFLLIIIIIKWIYVWICPPPPPANYSSGHVPITVLEKSSLKQRLSQGDKSKNPRTFFCFKANGLKQGVSLDVCGCLSCRLVQSRERWFAGWCRLTFRHRKRWSS